MGSLTVQANQGFLQELRNDARRKEFWETSGFPELREESILGSGSNPPRMSHGRSPNLERANKLLGLLGIDLKDDPLGLQYRRVLDQLGVNPSELRTGLDAWEKASGIETLFVKQYVKTYLTDDSLRQLRQRVDGLLDGQVKTGVADEIARSTEFRGARVLLNNRPETVTNWSKVPPEQVVSVDARVLGRDVEMISGGSPTPGAHKWVVVYPNKHGLKEFYFGHSRSASESDLKEGLLEAFEKSSLMEELFPGRLSRREIELLTNTKSVLEQPRLVERARQLLSNVSRPQDLDSIDILAQLSAP